MIFKKIPRDSDGAGKQIAQSKRSPDGAQRDPGFS
jgi:hypothetical protein